MEINFDKTSSVTEKLFLAALMAMGAGIDQEKLNDKDYVLSHVVPFTHPAEKDLDTALTIEDANLLGIKFAFGFSKEILGGALAVSLLKEKAIKELNITLIELVRAAERNIHPMIRTRLFSEIPGIKEIIELTKTLQQAGVLSTDKDPEMPLCSITAGRRMAGGALLDPLLPALIKEKLNTDSFYVLPVSVHELVAVPAYYIKAPEDVRHIQEAVAHINKTVVLPDNKEDYLSDNVFFYNGRRFSTILNFPAE